MKLNPRTALLALGLMTTGAWAGTATVSFTDPARYHDAGTTQWEAQDNLDSIARHIESLARRLPANESLAVEVLDVDLAGDVHLAGNGTPLRFVRGFNDWPRMHVRYTLQADGRAVRSADEWIEDQIYLRRSISRFGSDRPLYYEKRMLSMWFAQQFGPEIQAAAR